MSILVNKDTRLLVQGITGREGEFHTRQMLDYGTQIVAGTSPGKGGARAADERVPVFNTVREAVAATHANAACIFVPAAGGADAILEAGEAGVPLIVSITENIPVSDMIRAKAYLDQKGVRLIGPNCPGLTTMGACKVGIIPNIIGMPGPVGLVSRSGTLTYEVVHALTLRNIGQTTVVGIGGDPIIGTRFVDVLRLFESDPQTKLIVVIGEIGGNDEERGAQFIKEHVRKPVVGFIAGQTAPEGKRMGHAGAIISGGTGSAKDKIAALSDAGVKVARHPDEVAELVAAAI
ncbi:MAG: succinate--CoA ligase subunit alpha [Chloroflexi bacterium]|nr:MAG: succinate--CoA ligase subunit alpha [Chloroflexota bacterium]